MGKDGRDPHARDAPRSAERAAESSFDVPATVVDPHAGRRAAAAIAARGFGHHEAPTKESKDVAARLAAHERSMARQRGVTPPDPVLSPRTTPRSFDLRVDALEDVQGSAPMHFEPIEHGQAPGELSDRFDIPLGTSPGLMPVPRPSGRGMRLFLGALVALVLLAVAGFVGMQRGWLPRVIGPAPGSSLPGR